MEEEELKHLSLVLEFMQIQQLKNELCSEEAASQSYSWDYYKCDELNIEGMYIDRSSKADSASKECEPVSEAILAVFSLTQPRGF